ncbi:Membrane progestin receptor gamma-B [Liparis tanakae]|uniref:Membrane progestin receptor gamma-B n=1 Tax=Liparis tanakae TaxID=230148 RepID=A0A4Z2EZS8_9TELE|nr:Membrane progestin receptor gamma-B [Liparis tanakae]
MKTHIPLGLQAASPLELLQAASPLELLQAASPLELLQAASPLELLQERSDGAALASVAAVGGASRGAAVGGASRGPPDAHQQGAAGLQGAAHRQRVHVLRELRAQREDCEHNIVKQLSHSATSWWATSVHYLSRCSSSVELAVASVIFLRRLTAALLLVCRFLELQFPQWSKFLRTAAFVVPFLFDTVPLFYRIVLCCGGGCGAGDALSSHCYHLLFAFLTCFLFTAHLPERLAPGRFDYIGHSHQLFHVSAVVGTHFQMEGVMADMASRRALLLATGAPPSFLGTVGVLVASLLLNLGVIAVFSTPLLWNAQHAAAAAAGQPRTPKCKEQFLEGHFWEPGSGLKDPT